MSKGFKSAGKRDTSQGGQPNLPNARNTDNTPASTNQGALNSSKPADANKAFAAGDRNYDGAREFNTDGSKKTEAQKELYDQRNENFAARQDAWKKGDAARAAQEAQAKAAPSTAAKPSTVPPAHKGAGSKADADLGHPGKQFADRGATPAGFDPNKKGPLSEAEQAKAAQAAAGTYSRSGDQKWAAASINFAKKHKKKLAGGGGIAGIILVLVMGFFALLPLKLESILKNIMNHEMGRAENYVERRAQAILFRYIYQRATGTIASDAFYTNNSIIKTIYGNLELNKFTADLESRGMKIEKVGSRGIRITVDGNTVSAADEPELFKIINRDLHGREAAAAVNKLVNDKYHYIRFLKRRHMRKYLMNGFNIRKWSIKKQEDKKDAKDPNAPSSTVKDIQSAELDPTIDRSVGAVDCILGDNCEDPGKRNNPDGTSETHPPVPNEERTGDAAAAEATGAEETKKGIREAYKGVKEATTATIKKSLEAVFGEVITKGIFKAVPVVGWISLAADVDNFFWEGKISKVSISLKEGQYAAAAAAWGSLADQFKAGELTGSQVNVIMSMLNDIEKSRAVQCILFKNCAAGTPLPQDKRVGSDSAAPLADDGGLCGITWFGEHLGDSPPTSQISSPDFWTWSYRMVAGAPPQFMHPVLCAIRIPLNAVSGALDWLLGGVLSAITDAAIGVLNAAASAVVGHAVDVMTVATEGLSKLVNLIWSPVVTGREVGPALGNVIDAGWDVISNQFCRDVLGCQNITYKVAYEENLALADQHQAELNRLNPVAALMNTDYPESFGSQMLALLPSTPGAAVNNLGTTGLAMISNPFHLFATTIASFFPTAQAGPSLLEPNGVQKTGITTAQLEDPELHLALKDIAGPPGPDGKLTGPDGRKDQYDCPVISDPNIPNPCLVDTAAAQLLCASISKDDDGGLGGNGDPGDCGDVAAAAATAVPGVVDGACTPTDARACAKAILDEPTRVTYGGIIASGGPSRPDLVKHDLELTRDGQFINNADSCHNKVTLHPRLLYALYQASQKWTIKVDSFVTTHGGSCSSTRYHPQGRAMDIWEVGGVRTASSMSNPAKNNRAFAEFMAPLLKPKGEILQANKCFPATLPSYISDNYDTCDHIHVSVQN